MTKLFNKHINYDTSAKKLKLQDAIFDKLWNVEPKTIFGGCIRNALRQKQPIAQIIREIQEQAKDKVVPEEGAGSKESDCGKHERNDKSPLTPVEAGRNEQPHLKEDERRGQNGSPNQRDLDIAQVNQIGRVGEIELYVDFVKRSLHQ